MNLTSENVKSQSRDSILIELLISILEVEMGSSEMGLLYEKSVSLLNYSIVIERFMLESTVILSV